MSDANDTTTEIIRREGANGMLARPTSDVSAIQECLEELRHAGANILAPRTYVQGADEIEYAIKVLKFDPERDFFWTGSGNAPKKSALNQIASAAGIDWEDVQRLDDFSIPNFAACKAIAWAPDPATGQRRKYIAQYQLDLRDGSERAEELNAGMLSSKRQHIGPLADTGARLRVIRDVTNMRQDYEKHEIQKPFVVVSVVSRPDRFARMEQQHAAQEAAGQLYGDHDFDAQEANNPEMTAEVDPGNLPPAEPNLPDPESFPAPVDWQAAPADDQTSWLEDIIAVTGYDLEGKLADTKRAGQSVSELPFNWRESLYATVYHDELEPMLADDDGLEDPPF